jgi:monoamine oxidase
MHTVIVGGGIAGLWLADQLSIRGDRVTVLEKYDYLGGRIVTAKDGYEIGAGRLHTSHHRLRSLIRRFHLHTVPIGGTTLWMPLATGVPEPNTFDATWAAVLSVMRRLPPETLATHTLATLAADTMGPAAATALLNQYPYRTETELQRADVGIRAFDTEMRSQAGFMVVREGLSAVVRGLETACRKRGVMFHLNTEVANVQRHGDGCIVRVRKGDPIVADRVVLALHASALRHLPVCQNLEPLRHVGMAPLTRIYAKFTDPWPLAGKVVTDSPIRYIIPINPAAGLIMISYTDDRDTAIWHGLKGDALRDKMHAELLRLFAEVPEMEWIRPYEWTDGTTYWRPGTYDVEAASRAIMNPRPVFLPQLYICGESFSPYKQAWMEGALEHAAALLRTHLQPK